MAGEHEEIRGVAEGVDEERREGEREDRFASKFGFLQSTEGFARATQIANAIPPQPTPCEANLQQQSNASFSHEHIAGRESETQHKGEANAELDTRRLASPSSTHAVRGTSYDLTHALALSNRSIVVDQFQRGNPLLRYVRNVVITHSKNFLADYLLGPTTCALFLSLRYHLLHPEYIFNKVRDLGAFRFRLRVLLLLVDTPHNQNALEQLTKLALLAQLTLVCTSSNREAARVLEMYKMLEKAPPDSIMMASVNQNKNQSNARSNEMNQLTSRVASNGTRAKTALDDEEVGFLASATRVLTNTRAVNKTDALRLLATAGSIAELFKSSGSDMLRSVHGIGAAKLARLELAFETPFVDAGGASMNEVRELRIDFDDGSDENLGSGRRAGVDIANDTDMDAQDQARNYVKRRRKD